MTSPPSFSIHAKGASAVLALHEGKEPPHSIDPANIRILRCAGTFKEAQAVFKKIGTILQGKLQGLPVNKPQVDNQLFLKDETGTVYACKTRDAPPEVYYLYMEGQGPVPIVYTDTYD